MIKRCAVVVMCLALATSAATALDFEQMQWYGHGLLALPMGDFGDVANLGLGAGVGLTVPHMENLNFRGEISYIHFTTEDYPDADLSASMIPLVVLAEYHLESAYVLGGLGLVFRQSEVDFEGSDSVSDNDSEIGIILGGGLALSPSLNLEGRLNLISDSNYISAHVSFRF